MENKRNILDEMRELIEKKEYHKSDMIDFAQELDIQVLEGEKDPIELFVQLKFIEKCTEEMLKSKVLKDAVAEEFGSGEFRYESVKLSIQNRTTYLFDMPQWKALKSEMDNIKEEMKEFEGKQKIACGKPTGSYKYVDIDTGEEVEVKQCKSYTTTSPVVTFPK